jgi:transcriptional regulator with XRE-family HTH domain
LVQSERAKYFEEVPLSIGDEIRAARKAAGLTQEEVARRTQISLNAYSAIERGVVKDPHLSSLEQIANAVGVRLSDLLGDSEEKEHASRRTGLFNELAELLVSLGAPTQHLANPNLLDDLEKAGGWEFGRTLTAIDKEIELLTPAIRERVEATSPDSDEGQKIRLIWDQAGRQFIALKWLRRARKGTEPQKIDLAEGLEAQAAIRELLR